MVRSEYMLMVEDTFIVDCCQERKKWFEDNGYTTKVLIEGENLAIWDRHCCMKPCLRWKK